MKLCTNLFAAIVLLVPAMGAASVDKGYVTKPNEHSNTRAANVSPSNQNPSAILTQGNATTHLDRLDQRSLPLDGKYHYKSNGGQGVTVFVVDSGMRLTHSEFSGRATCGFDAVMSKAGNSVPCDINRRHGTAVGSLVGGATMGVAKAVSIVAVKVQYHADLTVEADDVVLGLNYVLRQKQQNRTRPMVVNLSLGMDGNETKAKLVDAAVQRLIRNNVTVVAAAGNSDVPAKWVTPARVSSVITVGATDPWNDKVWNASNFGKGVDIFAPGVDSYAASGSNDSEYFVLTGTSMATALVSGAAALYLQENPTWTPAQVWEAMRNDAIPNVIKKGLRGSPNLLLSTSRFARQSKNAAPPSVASKPNQWW